MGVFKTYESQPTVKGAYEIQKGDRLEAMHPPEFRIKTPEGIIHFTASHPVRPGDFIIKQSDDDVYHCPRDVFLEKYRERSGGKTLHNSDVSGARKNVRDIQVFGNGDLFRLLSKASSESEGWMKSTKAMETQVGCVVQVTTQQRNPDGSYSVAEALTFVPGVEIVNDLDGNPCLRPIGWKR